MKLRKKRGVLILIATLVILPAFLIWLDNGTKLGPVSGEGPVSNDAVKMLSALPDVGKLSDNGLRFVAMPSFGDAYAVALYMPRAGKGEALGVLAKASRFGQPVIISRFSMPERHYRDLALYADGKMDWYMGRPAGCYDGTPTVFERVRGILITSNIGGCSTARDAVMAAVLERIRPYASVQLPHSKDWEPDLLGK